MKFVKLNVFVISLLACLPTGNCDEVTFVNGSSATTLQGKIVAESDGNSSGILFQTHDGKLWPITKETIKEKKVANDEFTPLARKELGKKIKNELGKDFKILEAGNFVIIYNTHKDYARWIAGLYRRLERGFGGYWSKNKFKLKNKPKFTLPVIVFKSRLEYEQYMTRDIGGVSPEMMAYYNYGTNRVVMYDLVAGQQNGQNLKVQRINEVLNNPRAIPMVATIIHEGTHQLMFNYGMQNRFSDTPLWINEGMAMYFETPDLNASRGWGKIGQVNELRLQQFLNYLKFRPADALESMIQSDQGFRDENALNNYAQSWAFNYFLLTKHRQAYVKYLKHMSQKPLLAFDTPEQRLSEFQEHLELKMEAIERQFIQFIRTLNR